MSLTVLEVNPKLSCDILAGHFCTHRRMRWEKGQRKMKNSPESGVSKRKKICKSHDASTEQG